MASAKDIKFDQRNVTNTAYQEKYVNGNSLILRTDSTGSVIGTSTLEGVAIGTLTSSTANFTDVNASGRISSSNINVGIPSTSYPWGNSMTGSYFSTWTLDTNVSDALRFLAGAFSASFPIPAPNTKILSSVSTTNTNVGSTITINGRVPSGSTNQYINYLQPLGWATIGQTISADIHLEMMQIMHCMEVQWVDQQLLVPVWVQMHLDWVY